MLPNKLAHESNPSAVQPPGWNVYLVRVLRFCVSVSVFVQFCSRHLTICMPRPGAVFTHASPTNTHKFPHIFIWLAGNSSSRRPTSASAVWLCPNACVRVRVCVCFVVRVQISRESSRCAKLNAYWLICFTYNLCWVGTYNVHMLATRVRASRRVYLFYARLEHTATEYSIWYISYMDASLHSSVVACVMDIMHAQCSRSQHRNATGDHCERDSALPATSFDFNLQ